MPTLDELVVYQKAVELLKNISQACQQLPKDEKFLLCNQLLRSSRSVAANIAEGYGRFHFKENMQFLRQARGSLFETVEHLRVAKHENFASVNEQVKQEAEMFELLKILNGYISYLKKRHEEAK